MTTCKEDPNLLFDRCDLQNSGFLSYTDFLMAASKKSEILTEKNIKECFHTFDIFGKGHITYDDMERFYGKDNKKIWNQILIEAMEYYNKI